MGIAGEKYGELFALSVIFCQKNIEMKNDM